MAKKSSDNSKESEMGTTGKRKNKNKNKLELKDGSRSSIWGIVFIFLGLLITLSFFNKMAGPFGDFINETLTLIFGWGYYLLPIILVFIGYSFFKNEKLEIARVHAIFGLITILSILGIASMTANSGLTELDVTIGGYIGFIVSWPFVKIFGIYASILFLGALLIISLIVLLDNKPNLLEIFKKLKEILRFRFKSPKIKDDYEYDQSDIKTTGIETKPEESIEEHKEIEQDDKEETDDLMDKIVSKAKKFHADYVPPPLSLLEKDRGKPNIGDMKGNMNIIQRTLLTFGISVEMDEVTVGPTVTRYALKPAQGVKLSRIVGLQNELALALSAKTIRIEAPIPGKSLVGIEVPNKVKSTVGLATLLGDQKFQNSSKPLTIALGRGLSGKAIFGNLAKMPHLLVAGTTGSGKSVTIHSIITSLLYRNGPENLKFIMVDPKRVELTLYNKIPHLLTPVITDPKKTILALKWATKEMDRRYDILQAESVQNIESYNSNIYEKSKKDNEEAEKLPYIVVVIDELADIMQAYPRELESAIIRLAQMSRAVGIHLMLSTQRPSVNVITGLIKANIPTRIALQVSSQVDSRTILDQSGAEKLLGAGDMLYASAETPQPERLQSAFISEDEVKKVVEYLRKLFIDELPNMIELTGNIDKNNSLFSDNLDDSNNGEDDLYEDARMTVMEANKASTSYLQRKLGIGYARAAKLMDMLEERGVVGPANGSKPREILEKMVDNIQDENI